MPCVWPLFVRRLKISRCVRLLSSRSTESLASLADWFAPLTAFASTGLVYVVLPSVHVTSDLVQM